MQQESYFLTEQTHISSNLHRTIYSYVWVRFGIEDFHVMRLSNWEFRENWGSKRHTLLRGVNKILPRTLYIFRPIWIKFDIGELHIMPLRQCDVCEYLCNERYALLQPDK